MAVEQPNANESAVNWHFWLVVLLTQLFVIVSLPTQSLRAELWFETGKNFFATAYHESLWNNLGKTDAGYLPWLPRLIAVFVVKVLGCVQSYPVVVQAFSNLSFGLLSAIFCLRCYRVITPNDHIRFLVGMAFGCGLLADSGIYSLFNVAYAGIPAIVLVLCLDLTKLTRREYLGHLGLITLLMFSKGIFIAVFPLYFLALLHAILKRRGRGVLLFGLAMVAIATQTVSLKLNQVNTPELFGGVYNGKGLTYLLNSPSAYLQDLGTYFAETFPFVLFKQSQPHAAGQMVVLVLVICGGLIVAAARRGETQLVTLCVASVVFAVGAATILIVAHPFRAVPSGLNHFGASANFVVFLSVCAIIASQMRSHPAAVPLVGMMILAVLVRRPEPMCDPFREDSERHSQWKIYRFLVQPEGDYVVPLVLSPSVMSRNCDHLNLGMPYRVSGKADFLTHTGTVLGWNIRAVIYEQPTDHRGGAQPTKLVAYGPNGKRLGVATRLTPLNYRYTYFWFPERVLADWFVFTDDQDQPVAFHCENIRLYGK
jgi:hypothetical protein